MTRGMRFGAWALVIGTLASAGTVLCAQVEPVNKTRGGLAVKGYDVVAYFERGRAVKGLEGYEHVWMDATWRFESTEHRDRFAADPARYAPQFGGYCAWAVSRAYTADIDPEAWAVVDGKLYLNYDRDVQKKWQQEQAENIRRAEANWPKLVKR